MLFSLIPLLKHDALENREGNQSSKPTKKERSFTEEWTGGSMILTVSSQKEAGMRKECVALRGTVTTNDHAHVFCLILLRYLGQSSIYYLRIKMSTCGFVPFPSACSSRRGEDWGGRFELEPTFVYKLRTLAVRPEAMSILCNQARLEGERKGPAWNLYICNIISLRSGWMVNFACLLFQQQSVSIKGKQLQYLIGDVIFY